MDNELKWWFGDNKPNQSTTASNSTSYWCKYKNKVCNLATEYGYCQISACKDHDDVIIKQP